MNDREPKLDFKITPTGNLVLLTGRFTPPPGPAPLSLDDSCYPPQPICPAIGPKATYVGIQIEELGDHKIKIAKLAFRFESSLAQELSLLVQISEGKGEEYLWNEKFITNDFKLLAAGGSTYVIGLDQAAQEAAKRYFVSGNTLALVVLPPQKKDHFKVRVGMLAGSAARSKKAGR